MSETKNVIEVWVDYCFADDPLERPFHLHKFVEKYIKADAGGIWASLCIEDDRLVIDISTGFHCLHIPLDVIDQLRSSNKSGEENE